MLCRFFWPDMLSQKTLRSKDGLSRRVTEGHPCDHIMMPNRIWAINPRIIWFAAWKIFTVVHLLQTRSTHDGSQGWRIWSSILSYLMPPCHLCLVVETTFPGRYRLSHSTNDTFCYSKHLEELCKTNYVLLMAETSQICCKYEAAYRFHHTLSLQRGPSTVDNVENGILCRYAVFSFQHITQAYCACAGQSSGDPDLGMVQWTKNLTW